MERTIATFKQKGKKGLAAAFAALILLSSCALGPVETDPEKAAQRWAEMREYCYKQGGVWNDDVKTCLTAGKSY